ncbi:hypothetical protein [Virgibacillus doumboii]|uniref:hypothetical protein n=1 Tax=Virgibacillus doumboii TaxID=2697503 RepID=UPI0013DF4EFD|nr:hypothetical protein [Virgibacillus doumboii]
MFLKRFNRTGKVIAFTGMWIFAFGAAFNETISDVTGTPKLLTSFSIPLIVIGTALLIGSNFFRKSKR